MIAVPPCFASRSKLRVAVASLICVTPVLLGAQSSRVDRFLQSYVDSNRVAGAAVLVLRDGNVAYEKAVGWADREGKRAMTMDAIFRIASESKPVTSVAILQLAEA